MSEKVTVIVEAVTGSAVKNVDELKSKIDELNGVKEKSNDLDKEGQAATAGQSEIIRLFDQATGGAVTRVKDLVGRVKALVFEIRALNAAQIKANLAFLANPYVAVGAAVVGITAAFAKYASSLTDDVVPVTETLKNMFLSLGNAQEFARLQAESFTKRSTDKQVMEMERAIAVQKAFGTETIQQDIELQRRKLSLLEEGSQEYFDAQTQLSVLLAQADVAAETKKQQDIAEARQAALEEIQTKEQLDKDQELARKQLESFDEGEAITKAYYDGVIYGKEELKVEPGFEFLNENDELTPQEQAQLDRQIKLGEELVKAEKEKNEQLKQARQDLFLNLTSIFGAETKLGKAFLIAKQIQAARELAIEISKTIAFSKAAVARSKVAVAEGIAQTAKKGFPENIPLLIAYAAQAAGIIGVIKQATSEAGIAVATPAFVPAFPGTSPQIVQTIPNVSPVGRDSTSQLAEAIQSQQQRPIRAFVVSSDVTSAQELDRNIVEGASI
jgi:hypothetical protein